MDLSQRQPPHAHTEVLLLLLLSLTRLPCVVDTRTHAGGKGFGDPVTFDNAYYTALQAKPWLNPKDPMADMIGLPSDHVLPDDAECRAFIDAYAADQQLWFKDFSKAYQQLVSLGAVWV